MPLFVMKPFTAKEIGELKVGKVIQKYVVTVISCEAKGFFQKCEHHPQVVAQLGTVTERSQSSSPDKVTV